MKTLQATVIICVLLTAQPAQAYLWAIGGAVIGAVAAPFAIPAGLAAVGFTTAGITAGSAAAGFMASYGGAVAAGSACAVAQSIGAAGLGAAGTLAAGATGAAAGAIYEKSKSRDANDNE